MTRWALMLVVVLTAATGCRSGGHGHFPLRKSETIDCPPEVQCAPNAKGPSTECPPATPTAPKITQAPTQCPPTVEIREAPPIQVKLSPPEVVIQGQANPGVAPPAAPITQVAAPAPPMYAPPAYAPPAYAPPTYAAPAYAAPAATAPVGRSRLGFTFDFIRIRVPVIRPIAVPVAPEPQFVQPIYAQPVAPPVYAQPVAPPVYAQPVAQPVYAQPVAPPVYAQPVAPPVYAPPAAPPQCNALVPVPCPPGVAPGSTINPAAPAAPAAPQAPGGAQIDLKAAEEFCRQVEALKAALEAQKKK